MWVTIALDELFELAQNPVSKTEYANIQNENMDVCKTETPHISKMDTCLIDYKETKQETKADSPLGGKTQEKSPSKLGEEKTKPDIKSLIENTRKKVNEKKKKVIKPKPTISKLWRQTLEDVTQIQQKNLTDEDRGKLNHVAKSYPDAWEEIVKLVLNDWNGFASEVVIAKSMSQVPNEPHTGFFCKFCDVGKEY